MTTYIKLATLEYPRYEGDIRLEYPEITEDQTGETFPCPPTYAKVAWVEMPTFNANSQRPYEEPPTQIDGVWTVVWGVRELTEEEKDTIQRLASNIPVERV